MTCGTSTLPARTTDNPWRTLKDDTEENLDQSKDANVERRLAKARARPATAREAIDQRARAEELPTSEILRRALTRYLAAKSDAATDEKPTTAT